MLTARMLPMQVFMLFSQGIRCVHRMRLMTARNTCTAEVCAHPPQSTTRPFLCQLSVLCAAKLGCSWSASSCETRLHGLRTHWARQCIRATTEALCQFGSCKAHDVRPLGLLLAP